MATHRIDICNRKGRAVEASEEDPLLDSLEAFGFCLPYGCRKGVCVTCAARLHEGTVDQFEGAALTDAEIEEGFVLLCIAHPCSDCVIEVGAECQRELFANPFKDAAGIAR